MDAKKRFLMGILVWGVLGGFVACSKRSEPGAAGAGQGRKVLFYRNPMNPQITSPVPAKDDMGMDFIPVYADETATTSPVPGQAAVPLGQNGDQLIGVKVATVENRELAVAVRAPARVAYDPDLYSAIQEHREAVKNLQKAREGGSADYVSEAEATVRASTLRLRQMGLSQDQIKEVGQPGFDSGSMLLGEGGTVWVYADLYDYEAPLVKPGQSVELTASALPGQVFQGRVGALDTIINSETRTLRARVEVPNPRGLLRPEMYLSAMIHAAIGRHLAVPVSAVMDTGTRQLAYVEKRPGEYEPRRIRVGREAEGYYEVIDGLTAGEKVAISANFLLDSESKLRGAGSGEK